MQLTPDVLNCPRLAIFPSCRRHLTVVGGYWLSPCNGPGDPSTGIPVQDQILPSWLPKAIGDEFGWVSSYVLTVRLIGINKVFDDIPCAHYVSPFVCPPRRRVSIISQRPNSSSANNN